MLILASFIFQKSTKIQMKPRNCDEDTIIKKTKIFISEHEVLFI